MSSPLQFGTPHDHYLQRPSAYAVIRDNEGLLLVVEVRGRYHLPGGGIDGTEDAALAAVREVREETGYEAVISQTIGQANQFFEKSSLGLLNKTATFFTATITGGDLTASVEADHETKWIPIQDFLNSTAADFQKWAVMQSL